ncbi:hypothetical protein [Elizabethkingia anophelis]|uniref:hypothetical protein n=1 Tax=Elizabethkingia anophelis TaxID=1117645 RepID=UPI0021A4AC5D|nr:hypothetical protein [Elizabethkingia anophelis]
MIKNLFYPALWGILTLSTLSSCRTEDGAITQKQLEDKRFAVFVPKSGESINYARGFAFLIQRYDNLHKTNLSGINNNKPIIGNFNTSASINQNASITQNNEAYVEFSVHTKTFTEENGDKWVIYPKVQGNKVIGLIIGALTKSETYVSYYAINPQIDFYKNNIGLFQEALDIYLNQKSRLFLNAGIKPMAEGGQKCTNDGSAFDCNVDGVTITVPGTQGPIFPTLTPPPSPGGGDCSAFSNCNGGGGSSSEPPEEDLCGRAKRALSADNVTKAVQSLKDRMKDLNKKTNNEQLHIIRKDGNTNIVEGGENHVPFSPDIYTKGSVHDHNKLGQPMFPPHDINSFINTVRVQNYPPDPLNPRDKSGEAFLGIVTPDYNYFMIFNGTKDDIPPFWGEGVVNQYQEEFALQVDRYKIYNGPVPDNVLQQIFFEYLDKMGLKGKISLIKQINGNNYPITQNPDGTIDNNTTNPCNN